MFHIRRLLVYAQFFVAIAIYNKTQSVNLNSIQLSDYDSQDFALLIHSETAVVGMHY